MQINWEHVLTIFIASALINNFVFSRYLGLCIFFGVTKRMETAVGMSFTFTAVMLVGAALNWLIYTYVMVPYQLGFLKIVIFIGVVAAFVCYGAIQLRAKWGWDDALDVWACHGMGDCGA